MDNKARPRRIDGVNQKKLAAMLRDRRRKFGPRLSRQRNDGWAEYLKTHGIRRAGVADLAQMANGGKLQGKAVIQSDFMVGPPRETQKELEDTDLHASDIVFYIMDRDLAEKILALGSLP